MLKNDCISLFCIRILQCILDTVCWLFIRLCRPAKQHKLPPINNPLLLKTATELSQSVQKGEITARQVIEAYLDRIAVVNPHLNAVVQLNETALKKANDIDATVYGNEALVGVPFTCKDSIQVQGLFVTWGVPAFAGKIAQVSQQAVQNMIDAGAIHTAITNVPEFSMYHDSYNKLYGGTNNPYDLTRISGGSSGGEGALIASGGSLIGIGSDIAGSIRIPAFFCGIYGHKPTPGVVTLAPLRITPLAVYGPMCRYVDDLIPMLKCLAGEDIAKLPKIDDKVDLKRLAVFYMLESRDPLMTPLQEDCRIPVKKAVEYFESIGVKCAKVDIPEFHDPFNIWLRSYIDTAKQSHMDRLRQSKSDVNLWFEVMKFFFGKSTFTHATLTLGLLFQLELWRWNPKRVEQFRRDYEEFTARFYSMLGDNGVFLFPSHPEVAPKHESVYLKIFNSGYTMMFNVLKVPATQCPMGFNPQGLPTGLQIAGAPFNDHLTIGVAKELNKKFGGWVQPS